MTTLEEISACPAANREFWTERARLALFMHRHHKVNSPAVSRAAKMAFRRCMKDRRAKTFYACKV